MKDEITPKNKDELKRKQDMKFNIKVCDMGNACYIDRHYSDII